MEWKDLIFGLGHGCCSVPKKIMKKKRELWFYLKLLVTQKGQYS